MPAVGILKKPPHPDPPPSVDRVKPPRPPKPKRGIPPPPPRAAEIKRNQDVHFVDEDEPTTEESYDYKDIDFANEIFDWRIPPPRPKPPRLQANGIAHKVADSMPVVVGETLATTYDTRQSNIEQRLEPVAEEEAKVKEDSKTEGGEAGVKTDRLAVFLTEHEGKELTMDDVKQLELLLDEAEGVQRERDQDPVNGGPGDDHDEEGQKYEEGAKDDAERQEHEGEEEGERFDDASRAVMQPCNEEGWKHNGEPKGMGKVTCVRFSDEDERDLSSGELRGEIPDDEAEDGRPSRHADYGIMHFFHAAGKKAKKGSKAAKDSGMYEPVGRQDLRFVRPDMSGYKPPEPSDVGDPFSWRRREKPHHYLYGYESTDLGEEPTPSMDKIIDGCQEVEEMIKSRDLTPPGMLFDSLGRKKRVRKVRPPSPPPRPPPPVPPKMRIPSPLPPIPTEPELDAVEERDVGTQFETEAEERQLEMERQILTDLSFVESLVGSVSVKEDVLVSGSLGDGGRELLTAIPRSCGDQAEVEDVIVPMDASSYLTGDGVGTAAETLVSDAVAGDDLPEGSAANNTDDQGDGGRVAPRRVSRRDSAHRRRPPRPAPPCISAKPIPPERRKRVASAEPPLTAFEREERVAPPRNKAKRSVSFHTAEEIRKRIDVQAQSYLRTPRRKDRMSCAYLETSPSASAALNYGSLRRDHRRPLTPVYSHVNKEAPRRKETAVQTNGSIDEDTESLPPIPPPKLRDSELMSPCDDPDHGKVTPEPVAESVPEDSVVPADFSSAKQAPSEETPDAGKNSEVINDSVVPQEFLTLSKTRDEPPKAGQESEEAQLTSGHGRPLPPPPAPPRHRGVKAKSMALDGPVVICGILPKGEEGKMTVLSDLKVLRLSVVQLDASMIRVGQIEAEHVVVRRLDAPDDSRTPTPSSQRPPDPDPDLDQGGKMLQPRGDAATPEQPEKSPEKGDATTPPLNNGNNNNNINDVVEDEILQDVEVEKLTQRLQAPLYDLAHIRVASPVEGFNVWDEECTQDRAECPSPTNTLTSTTSGSASYVTCDETLHEGSDVTADGLDIGAADEDFGFGLDEDDIDDIDGRGTGCSTPTEMDVTLGSDIPLAALPIFAPPSEPYLPSPASAHSHLPMDTDTDENFNSFGGDDSRDPSNTVGI